MKPSRTWHQQYTKQYSFVSTFTNICSIIEQEETSLLNHCLITQRPHARLRAMPCTLLSFTNNNPFYYKQSSAAKTIAVKFKQLYPKHQTRSAHPTLLSRFNFIFKIGNTLFLKCSIASVFKVCPKFRDIKNVFTQHI